MMNKRQERYVEAADCITRWAEEDAARDAELAALRQRVAELEAVVKDLRLLDYHCHVQVRRLVNKVGCGPSPLRTTGAAAAGGEDG